MLITVFEVIAVHRHINVGMGFPIFAVLFALIAYFVYGKSVDAAMAIFILDILLSLFMVVSIIPLLGVVIYYFMGSWIYSWVLDMAGIQETWITLLIWYLSLGISALISIGLGIMILHYGTMRCYIEEGKRICRSILTPWR